MCLAEPLVVMSNVWIRYRCKCATVLSTEDFSKLLTNLEFKGCLSLATIPDLLHDIQLMGKLTYSVCT